MQRRVFRLRSRMEEVLLPPPARADEEERLIELEEANIALAISELWGRVTERGGAHTSTTHRVPEDRTLRAEENTQPCMRVINNEPPRIDKAL